MKISSVEIRHILTKIEANPAIPVAKYLDSPSVTIPSLTPSPMGVTNER